MFRLWPAPGSPAPLSDDDLHALYAPPDRTTPRLRLNFVSSVDGAVTVDGKSGGLSGPVDKRVFGLLREVADAVVVGAGTLRGEGYGGLRVGAERAARRRMRGQPEHPALVIVSTSLSLRPDSPVFTDAPVRPILLTSEDVPAADRAAFDGVADVVARGSGGVDLKAGLAELAGRGLTQVLSEGGPTLLGALSAADLIDDFCLTVAPVLAGPGAGRITAGEQPHRPLGMRLAHVLTDDDVLLLRYERG